MRAPVTFVERYLHNLEKLEKQDPRLQKLFWSARQWHPVVKLKWLDMIVSDGVCTLTYPDGSRAFYETVSRPKPRPAPTPPQDGTTGEGGAS